MAEMDADGSGEVDFVEFKNWWACSNSRCAGEGERVRHRRSLPFCCPFGRRLMPLRVVPPKTADAFACGATEDC